jgi:class 3 adenylate cyclase/tetratricopeptide (TPR) repeat protein
MAQVSVASVRPIALAWLEQAGERRYVESETRIGRGEQNDLRLNDQSVSRDHALIRRVDGVYLISDLDSANGTFVNDQRVYAPRPLSRGDRIRLAETTFTFNVDAPETTAVVDAVQPISTSISQFLTISGQIDVQNYLQGELRVVTVLFLDLSGFTALSEKMSPEQVTLLVNQCFQRLTETAIRFGGFVDKYIGDAMMVLFGAPTAHDDDAERSVRAAIAMQAELANFSERLRQRSGITLQMRVGINTGEVLAGEIGSAQFSAFTVMGDTVNLASRLEGHARIGHILVNETTYQLTKQRIRYSALAPIPVKGKNDLVAAYEVLGVASGDESLAPPTQTPFVGRQTELGVLEQLLADSGRLRRVMVIGAAGIGKSRLVSELCRRHAHQARAVVLHCVDIMEQGAPAALRTAMPPRPRMVALEPQAEALVAVIDAAFNAFASELRELARLGPVVLVLDRIDAADAATLASLERLSGQLVDTDVLLVGAARSTPEGDWPKLLKPLELRELSFEDAGSLVRGLLQSERVEPASVDRLLSQYGGTPLVLEQMIGAARASGVFSVVDNEWRLRGEIDTRPMLRLRSLVQARLDQLSSEERNLLRVASLVGEPWTAQLIGLALETPAEVDRTLSHLVELGLLTSTSQSSDARYAFHDESIRAVIDASLPQMERRRLHERIAVVLQQEYDPTRPDPVGLKRMARHFVSAGQHWQGVEYLLRSAELAAAAAPPGAAVDQYRLVLDEADHVTDHKERTRLIVELQERIGDALLKDGSLAEAQIAFETAASAASPERQVELRLKLAATGVRRGNPRRVLEITKLVLGQAGMPDSSRATAEALAALGLVSWGVIPEALERAERSVRLLSNGADGGSLGLAHYAAGRAHFAAGQLTSARNEAQLSVASRDQAPDRSAVAESCLLLGLILCEMGEPDEAEANVRRALTAGPVTDRWNRASAGLLLGRLRRMQTDTSRAIRHVQEALAAAEAAGARDLALELNLELASLNEARVDFIRSLIDAALARQLEPIACRARIQLAETLCARALSGDARDEDQREALRIAHQAALQSRGMGLTLHEALARRVLGQVLAQSGHWSHAAREFEAAATIQEERGATVGMARTLMAACQAEYSYASAPRTELLRAQLARVCDIAERIGMNPEREAAKRLLAAVHD